MLQLSDDLHHFDFFSSFVGFELWPRERNFYQEERENLNRLWGKKEEAMIKLSPRLRGLENKARGRRRIGRLAKDENERKFLDSGIDCMRVIVKKLVLLRLVKTLLVRSPPCCIEKYALCRYHVSLYPTQAFYFVTAEIFSLI